MKLLSRLILALMFTCQASALITVNVSGGNDDTVFNLEITGGDDFTSDYAVDNAEVTLVFIDFFDTSINGSIDSENSGISLNGFSEVPRFTLYPGDEASSHLFVVFENVSFGVSDTLTLSTGTLTSLNVLDLGYTNTGTVTGLVAITVGVSEPITNILNYSATFPAAAVPEPSVYAGLLGLAAVGFVVFRRRRR